MTKFQAFWLGLNTARKEQGLGEVFYGEARVLYALACEQAKVAA